MYLWPLPSAWSQPPSPFPGGPGHSPSPGSWFSSWLPGDPGMPPCSQLRPLPAPSPAPGHSGTPSSPAHSYLAPLTCGPSFGSLNPALPELSSWLGSAPTQEPELHGNSFRGGGNEPEWRKNSWQDGPQEPLWLGRAPVGRTPWLVNCSRATSPQLGGQLLRWLALGVVTATSLVPSAELALNTPVLGEQMTCYQINLSLV